MKYKLLSNDDHFDELNIESEHLFQIIPFPRHFLNLSISKQLLDNSHHNLIF